MPFLCTCLCSFMLVAGKNHLRWSFATDGDARDIEQRMNVNI